MSDQPPDERDPADAGTFDDWIQEVARSEGISEQELADKVMSSYWVLDELRRVMSEFDSDALHQASAGSPDQSRNSSESSNVLNTNERENANTGDEIGDLSSDELSQAAELLSVVADSDLLSGSEERESSGENEYDHEFNSLRSQLDELDTDVKQIKSELRQLLTNQQQSHPTDSAPGAYQSRSNESDSTIDETDLLSLLAHVSAGHTRTSQDTKNRQLSHSNTVTQDEIDGLAAEIEAVSEKVNKKAEQSEIDAIASDLEALSSQVDEIQSRYDELASAVDESADQTKVSQLQDLVSDLQSELSQTRSLYQKIDSRTKENFGEVEDVLNHFLQELDEIDSRMESLTGQVESATSRSEQDTELNKIKQEANKKGIETAKCEECGETVSLPLLTRPACPHCDRPADGVSERSWFWESHTLDITDDVRADNHHSAAGSGFGNPTVPDEGQSPSSSKLNDEMSSINDDSLSFDPSSEKQD